MESTRLSERIHQHFVDSTILPAEVQPAWPQGTLEIVGKFFYGLAVPSTWCLVDIQRFDQGKMPSCAIHHVTEIK